MCHRLLYAVLLLTALLAGQARSQISPEAVKAGKAATALVELLRPGVKAFGTAFCVEAEEGIFITNAHVAAGRDKLRLVLNPGETTEASADATVVRVDEAADLAILQVKFPQAPVALPLGDIGTLIDTMPLTAFGYPFGDALAMQKGEHPSISVNTGRITSLRKKKGELELIQLDAALNPGNSGGPVLDAQGRVVGIVQAGVRGSGVNFAIPVSRLQTMLARPEIRVGPTTLPYEQRTSEQEVRVSVVSVIKPKTPHTVTVTFNPDQPTARTIAATVEKTPAGTSYVVRAVPVPPMKGPEPLSVTAKFAAGQITCRVSDRPVKVAEQSLPLASVAQIDRPVTGPARVTLADGTTVSGALSGLEAVPASLGEVNFPLNLGAAASIRVEKLIKPARQIPYKVAVTSGDAVVAESSGRIDLVGAPSDAAAAATLPAGGMVEAPLEADVVRRKLPAPIDNVVAGGGGRFLFLHLKKLRKIAVFDVNQAKVTQFLPLGSDDVLMAANAEKLIIVARDQNVIQKWDLSTMEKELTAALPEGQLDDIAMGHAGTGPLMMVLRTGPKFFDPNRLTPLDLKLGNSVGNWLAHAHSGGLRVATSADGSTFAGWSTNTSPLGVRLLRIEGRSVRALYEHDSAAPLMPSYDGGLLFTGQGMYSADLKRLNPEQLRNTTFLPTYNPAYFLGLNYVNVNGAPTGNRRSTLSLYTSVDRRLVLTLNELNDLPAANIPDFNRGATALPVYQRIHVMPDANLIVLITDQRDELVLRQFRITEALDKAGIDYLFVTSTPPKLAKQGQLYQYAVQTRSKRGDVRYKLDDAPPGMRISPDGVLEWQVPADHAFGKISVILTIRDASGQEMFHTFSLAVE